MILAVYITSFATLSEILVFILYRIYLRVLAWNYTEASGFLFDGQQNALVRCCMNLIIGPAHSPENGVS